MYRTNTSIRQERRSLYYNCEQNNTFELSFCIVLPSVLIVYLILYDYLIFNDIICPFIYTLECDSKSDVSKYIILPLLSFISSIIIAMTVGCIGFMFCIILFADLL